MAAQTVLRHWRGFNLLALFSRWARRPAERGLSRGQRPLDRRLGVRLRAQSALARCGAVYLVV